MGIMDEINDQAEADRVKFEKDQKERVERSKALNKEMGEHGVPEAKRPT